MVIEGYGGGLLFNQRGAIMETEKTIPSSTSVTEKASPENIQNLRKKMQDVLNEVGVDLQGATTLAAVRCGGGCHQGVID